MNTEQLIVYLMALLDSLDLTIENLKTHVPEESRASAVPLFSMTKEPITTYPTLEPIFEYRYNLYEQIATLKRLKQS